MSRPLRIEYPGAWYHVMNRGRRREPVYVAESDYKLFLEILNQTSELFQIEIHAYALIPNHYHLLIRTPLGNISRCMRHINGVYTQKINKKYKTDGSLFRERFKASRKKRGQVSNMNYSSLLKEDMDDRSYRFE